MSAVMQKDQAYGLIFLPLVWIVFSLWEINFTRPVYKCEHAGPHGQTRNRGRHAGLPLHHDPDFFARPCFAGRLSSKELCCLAQSEYKDSRAPESRAPEIRVVMMEEMGRPQLGNRSPRP